MSRPPPFDPSYFEPPKLHNCISLLFPSIERTELLCMNKEQEREVIENEISGSKWETADAIHEFKEVDMDQNQTFQWNKAINDPEFIALTKRRQQLQWLFAYFEKVRIGKCSHLTIARKFGISRQAAEVQVNKAIKGTKPPHRPSLLNDDELKILKKEIKNSFASKKWLRYDEIFDIIEEKFDICAKQNSLRVHLSHYLKDIGKVITAVPIEDKRHAVPEEEIDRYFEKLAEILPLIDYRFCYNLDETGEDEYVDAREVKVYVPVDFEGSKTTIPVSRVAKRFTIVHSICTDGSYLPLYIIIPRKTLDMDFFYLYDLEQVKIQYQEKGFINEKLFQDYFYNLFIPNLLRKRQMTQYYGPALLIMDNLLVHKKVVGCEPKDSYKFLQEYNLHVLFLVPHSSDQTQPLDLGIFANHKKYSQNINPFPYLSASTNMLHRAIAGIQKATTISSVVNAFDAGGIARKFEQLNSKVVISLHVDKSRCIAVRHYNGLREERRSVQHRLSIV